MYRWIAKGQARNMFDRVAAGDYQAVLSRCADDVHHRFEGQHALGGERHGKDALRLWLRRLHRLFPDLRFTIHDVAVSGYPWQLVLAVEWSAQVSPAAGDPYVNRGTHVLRIRRGRVTSIHAYEDSQLVAEACRVMAEQGVDEAGADPIIKA